MPPIRRKASGFTLIELLLYIAITPLLLGSAYTLFSLLSSAQAKQQSLAEVEQQGDYALRLILQAVRSSSSISSPLPGGSAASLSLEVDGAFQSPTVFDLSLGVLRAKEGGSAPEPLTSSRLSVSDLLFQNLSRPGSPGLVRVSFRLNHANPAGRIEFDASRAFLGSASLRWP